MAKAQEQSVIFFRTSRTYTIMGLVFLLLGKVSKLGLSNQSHSSLPGQRDHKVFTPH